jgi:GntR family transcriptional regulator
VTSDALNARPRTRVEVEPEDQGVHAFRGFSPIDALRSTCHIIHVTALRFQLRPGEPIVDQVVFAAQKAFISGEFQPGQTFPSVRTLASALKIHPNTAHKAIQYLIQERWLEVHQGVGTVVAKRPEPRRGDKKRLLQEQLEQLVVEAIRVELDLRGLLDAIEDQWAKLQKPQEVAAQ